MIDLNATKSRLGSLSPAKLQILSPAAHKLLTVDMPKMLAEIQAAREVISSLKFENQNLPFFVHERLTYYNNLARD